MLLTIYIFRIYFRIMANKTLFSIKTDKKLKKEAQEVAKELGLPLSVVINQYLREFVKEREVTFRAPVKPNAKTGRILGQTAHDIKLGKNVSESFHSWPEVKKHLDSLKK
jgi:addiction module RelB/DinJ family antitoxin